MNSPAPLGPQVNAILSNFPGFSGIALALDKAEQFPGVIWYVGGDSVQGNNPASWFTIFSTQDFVGPAIRSVIDTVVSNTIPLLVRGFIVFIGLILVVGLLRNAIQATGIPETVGQISRIGAAAG